MRLRFLCVLLQKSPREPSTQSRERCCAPTLREQPKGNAQYHGGPNGMALQYTQHCQALIGQAQRRCEFLYMQAQLLSLPRCTQDQSMAALLRGKTHDSLSIAARSRPSASRLASNNRGERCHCRRRAYKAARANAKKKAASEPRTRARCSGSASNTRKPTPVARARASAVMHATAKTRKRKKRSRASSKSVASRASRVCAIASSVLAMAASDARSPRARGGSVTAAMKTSADATAAPPPRRGRCPHQSKPTGWHARSDRWPTRLAWFVCTPPAVQWPSVR